MIASMTAYARTELNYEPGKIIWEFKSVNHRYLQVHISLPEQLRMLEEQVRQSIAERFQRGKISCTLYSDANDICREGWSVDLKAAGSLIKSAESIQSLMNKPSALNAMDVLRWPGVMSRDTAAPASISGMLMEQLDKTLEQAVEMRLNEGEKMQSMILKRCRGMTAQLQAFKDKLPDIQRALRSRLTDKLKDISMNMDADRLEQELLFLVQKSDVNEELERLDAHLEEVGNTLQRNEPVGRRLDFLMQELQREANTLGAKTISLDYANVSIELKVLIEQMREQIQNIE